MGRIDEYVYVLDANSLYPHMMAEYKYPCRLIGVDQGPTLSQVEKYCETQAVCATVEISTRKDTYPYRDGKGSRNVLGNFCTTIATPEILRGLRLAQIKRVYSASRYETVDLFSAYIGTLYKMKTQWQNDNVQKDGNPYKGLMNSLYGKFGQHHEAWLSVDTVRPLAMWAEWSQWNPETKEACEYRSLAGRVEQSIKDGDWLHAFPAIAAHVTSYGREYVRNLITIAGVEHVFYTDTDSLHCNSVARGRLSERGLLHEAQIGKLRCEAEATEAEYRGRRYYRIGSECSVSGATFRPQDWTAGRTQVDQTRGARTVLTSGPETTITHKTVQLQYHDRHIRGAVLPDGRVLPEVIGDGQIDVDEGAL
jgi:DNA polymerase elongation subunit (family B)